MTEKKWLIEVDKLRTFARMRDEFVKSELVRLLAPEGWIEMEINNDKGKVSINENYPICLPFKGQYLKGFGFRIEALDDGCHQFISWSDGDSNRIKLVTADTVFKYYPVYECVIPEALKSESKDEVAQNKPDNLWKWLLYIGYSFFFLGLLFLLYLFLRTKKARK